MATTATTTKYKSCPLKKRPIVYDDEAETLPAIVTIPTTIMATQYYNAAAATTTTTTPPPTFPAITIKQEPELDIMPEELPQDLSLKRKASVDFEDYSLPAKREFVLNLSKDKGDTPTAASAPTYHHQHHYRPDSPAVSVNSHHSSGELAMSSAMLSPALADYDIDYYQQQQQQQQQTPTAVDIHLRGLTAASSGYTTASIDYKSAFMVAAGATPMTALWSAYQPVAVGGGNLNTIFPSPASSIATSPRSAYSYQHITPPSSPASEAGSEPEDLTIRNDIPLPALYHNSNAYANSNVSRAHKSSSNTSANNRNIAEECSANISSAANAANTANKHANYRYKCEKCNKMYSTSIGLSKHQQFHCPAAECNQDKKQHSCHECGKLYTTVGALKMHIRTHTLPCKCPICGKAFSRPWLLQGHIRTHTGEKPFQCNDCPRSFADRSNLRAHQQTHVDVKKYACKVCNKSFSRMSLLNKHVSSNCTITIA